MSFLDREMCFRLRDIEKAEIEKCVKQNKEIYENVSHFCRCAVLKMMRDVKNA